MKIKIGMPKDVSVEAEVGEEEVKRGIAKLYEFIKSKFPFKIEVSSGKGEH
jgi:hypothetical protein